MNGATCVSGDNYNNNNDNYDNNDDNDDGDAVFTCQCANHYTGL